jgi:hypothetical protein
MLCDLRLPKINPNMSCAVVECIYANPSMLLKAGDKLFDLSVDLSNGYSQYCPPISYFRLVVRENLWLQKLFVKPGDSCDAGNMLALFASDQTEPVDALPTRAVRVVTAGIMHHPGLWSANQR